MVECEVGADPIGHADGVPPGVRLGLYDAASGALAEPVRRCRRRTTRLVRMPEIGGPAGDTCIIAPASLFCPMPPY